MEHLYGERGIPAGEVFTTLPEEPSHTISVWFPVCGEILEPGTYRIRLERLFGVSAEIDAAGQYTGREIYTEYGDYSIEFTLPGPQEPIPTTEPITEKDLLKLEMVRYDGEKTMVIWEAE